MNYSRERKSYKQFAIVSGTITIPIERKISRAIFLGSVIIFPSHTTRGCVEVFIILGSSAPRHSKSLSMATLDELITEAGLRKTELAVESGINAATISRISHRDATTRVTVVKIVRVLERHLNRTIDIDSIQGLNITK